LLFRLLPLSSSLARALDKGENPDDPSFSKKPFECKLCNASFFRGDRLLAHSRMHTGEKPFQCDICPRSFSRKDRLKAHRRSHTGEVPHECSVCHKTFTQAAHLAKHFQSHSHNEARALSSNGMTTTPVYLAFPAQHMNIPSIDGMPAPPHTRPERKAARRSGVPTHDSQESGDEEDEEEEEEEEEEDEEEDD
jgi:uncharacterized Zn-finger protein